MAKSKLPPELRGLLKAVKILTMGRLEQKKIPTGTLGIKVFPDPSHRRNRENIFGVIDIHFRPKDSVTDAETIYTTRDYDILSDLSDRLYDLPDKFDPKKIEDPEIVDIFEDLGLL